MVQWRGAQGFGNTVIGAVGPRCAPTPRIAHSGFCQGYGAHALKGAKIAWLGDWGLPFDDGIMDISERAVGDWRALGADVTAIDAPFSMDALWESWITLRSWMVASGAGVFYDDPEKRDLLKPAAVWEIERGLAMSAREVHQQSVVRSMWFKRCQLFETYDALLMPSAQVWPFPVDCVHPPKLRAWKWIPITVGCRL